MLNFFGYYIRSFSVMRGIVDFLIIFLGGAFLYSFFGLASTGSTTPNEVSPFVLSLVTGIVTWVIIFAIGTYDLPRGFDWKNLTARLIAVFFIAVPLELALWWAVGFVYLNSIFVPVITIAIQLCLFFIVRILYAVILPNYILQNRAIVIAPSHEVEEVKEILLATGSPYKIAYVIPPENLNKHNNIDLAEICKKYDASLVVVGHEKTMKLLKAFASCRFSNIRVMDINLLKEKLLGKVTLEKYYSYHVIFDKFFAVSLMGHIIKRSFDLVVATVILLLTLPITATVGMLIYLHDRHNIFYAQKRVGRAGQVFACYKFRSMRVDAEQNGAVWAQENDDRVTPIGRFIRKTRIDEIPQCLNVLLGEMSIVGPRPERPEFVKDLSEKIPMYSERHYVKPGLTGWAQINESYGASVEDAERKLEYDLYYLKHYNIVLDVLILMKTLSVVLWPNGVR
ncbi:MAG: exopolysaccharide biosynthesis polyprenyl glycosylphosphotransferase [Pseudomonadota bacterium]